MIIQSKNFGSKTAIVTKVNKEKYKHVEHIHEFSELVYVLNGEMDVTVGNKTETAKAGDIIVVPPLMVHAYNTKVYNEHWMATFSNDLILDLITPKELYSGGTQYVFTPSEELRVYLTKRLEDGNRKIKIPNTEETRFFKATLNAVYEEYFRYVPVSESRKNIRTLSRILLYMHENSAEQLTLETVGKALGYSPKYVSKCLSTINGLNFYRILNSFRAERAKKLLTKTSLKIIDIGFECGYSSERVFRRAFHQVTGKTPGQYRKDKD